MICLKNINMIPVFSSEIYILEVKYYHILPVFLQSIVLLCNGKVRDKQILFGKKRIGKQGRFDVFKLFGGLDTFAIENIVLTF